MNAWYFTFEYPPEFGGGLSEYMRNITEIYRAKPEATLAIFALDRKQSGIYREQWLESNILVVWINPAKDVNAGQLGDWVEVSAVFAKFAEFFLGRSGRLIDRLGCPDFIEFSDGFGIGHVTIQKKLSLSRHLRDIPIIVTAHTPTYFIDRLNRQPIQKLPTFWNATMELSALTSCDAVISPSRSLLEELKADLRVPLPSHAVIPNPYMPRTISNHDANSSSYNHFYMASRLTHWKGVESAIAALDLLWRDGCEVPFIVYGQDTIHSSSNEYYGQYLMKKYRKHFDRGLVRLKGLTLRHDIDEASRHAFAQLHPSHFDNFPYSLLEAMQRGMICVAGKRGGIGEISKDRESILLCDVNDPIDFSAALKDVMTMTPSQRRAMGECARKTIESSCSYETYWKAKSEFIRSVKREHASRRNFPFTVPTPALPKKLISSVGGGPELSVVIPYFNMGDFIDQTLESVYSNHQESFEIILVNDGSTNPKSISHLGALHKIHGLDHDRLKIFDIPNGGVAKARNFGAERARGRFLTLLDADDEVAPNYYERAIAVLKEYDNVAFSGCWIEDYNEQGRIRDWATWTAEPPLQLVMNQTNCQSLVYHREVFLKYGKHDPDLAMFLDDWDGVLSLLAQGFHGVMIPEAMFRYRIRGDSIFRSKVNLWDLNFEKITAKHRHLYNAWGADLVAFLNANGPNNFYHIAGKPSSLAK